jgi:hypothetical protein
MPIRIALHVRAEARFPFRTEGSNADFNCAAGATLL